MSARRGLVTMGLLIALLTTTGVASHEFALARERAQQRATATPLPPINLLRNGDFEGEFARQWNTTNGEWANGRVAAGWTAWWRKPTASDEDFPGVCPEDAATCQPWHRPEYRETKGIPYSPPRVRSGDNSQVYFTSFGLHDGGLYHKASGVTPGWTIRFSIWAQAWSSDTEDTTESRGQPSMNLQVGIDPNGGTDPWSADVVWSEPSDSFDAFGEFSVSALARSETVTVFFRSRPERALKHVDVMVDDAELVLLGPPPPTPVIIDAPNSEAAAATSDAARQIVIHVVQPGDSLFAIAQRYRAELSAIYAANGLNESSVLQVGQAIRVPLPVAAPPTAVPTPAPLPEIAFGTLCVTAFEDVTGDGRRGPDDRALHGVEFLVADATGRRVAAADQAWCFDELPVGAYQVAAALPAGYLGTTEMDWGVSVAEGARVEVAVGARRVESDVEPAPDATPIAVGAGAIVFTAAAIAWGRRRAKST
jgi:LysM repeat protein